MAPTPLPAILTTSGIPSSSFYVGNGTSTNTSWTISTGAVTGNTKFASGVEVSGDVTASNIIIDGVNLKEVIRTIRDRLAILVPDPKKLKKYEALQNAYQQYKILEALCSEDETNEPKV